MADRDQTLLFCIGAAKAGTTWLYRYLAAHPDCHLRTVKELHYFDTLDLGEPAERSAALRRERNALKRRLREADGVRKARLVRQVADVEELGEVFGAGGDGQDAYLAYLAAGGEGRALIGDITPAYALLSAERFGMMAGLSPAARFVYLLRDPVDRLWSHVRMMAARRLDEGGDIAEKSLHILDKVVRKGAEGQIVRRGDYAGTLARLTGAVPAARVLVEFTERLMSEAGIRRLCAFLGIGYTAAPVTVRVGEGPRVALPDDLRRQAAAFLRPQYDYVGRTLGPLPERWQANLAMV